MATSGETSGLRVHYFRDLANPGTYDLRTLALDESVPMSQVRECPACGAVPEVLCTLIAGGDAKCMRIGCCGACGWWGYLDRPTKEWMVSFYTKEWDNAAHRDSKEETRGITGTISAHQRAAVHLAESLPRDIVVCDIGCGKGGVLKEFERMGFTRLVGVENSAYRAALVREKWGYPVVAGAFESEAVGREIKARAPINLFFSYHVLEHVYEPHEIMAAIASLQREGDHLILSMPHIEREPKIVSLFWLPHLHGWTLVALEKLLNRYGYEIVDDIAADTMSLTILARKTTAPRARYAPEADYLWLYRRLVVQYFALGTHLPGRRFAFWWTSKAYRTGEQCVFQIRALDTFMRALERTFYWVSARMAGIFSNRRSVVVSELPPRPAGASPSPLEIRFDGHVELLVR